MELTKSVLAWLWHDADVILDTVDAPRGARLALAWLGVAWSTFFLGHSIYKLTRPQFTETNPRVS